MLATSRTAFQCCEIQPWGGSLHVRNKRPFPFGPCCEKRMPTLRSGAGGVQSRHPWILEVGVYFANTGIDFSIDASVMDISLIFMDVARTDFRSMRDSCLGPREPCSGAHSRARASAVSRLTECCCSSDSWYNGPPMAPHLSVIELGRMQVLLGHGRTAIQIRSALPAGPRPPPGGVRPTGVARQGARPSPGRARCRGEPAAGARPPAAVRPSPVPRQFQTSSKPVPNQFQTSSKPSSKPPS